MRGKMFYYKENLTLKQHIMSYLDDPSDFKLFNSKIAIFQFLEMFYFFINFLTTIDGNSNNM